MPDQKYEYAVGQEGDASLILRRGKDDKAWTVVACVSEGQDAASMVDDLNMAQRVRPMTLEPGQEMVRRPLKKAKKKS